MKSIQQAIPREPIAEPADESRVLVAVITRPADLQRAREAGWYRIPVAHAPREMAADYLALYQTGAFGEEGHAIRYYAAILSCRITTRRELLPEEASHPRAEALYYCLHLGPIATLPLPIPAARLRRITFLITNFGQLRRAGDVRDLWHPTGSPRAPDVWGAGIAGQSVRE